MWNIARRVDVDRHVWIYGRPRRRTYLLVTLWCIAILGHVDSCCFYYNRYRLSAGSSDGFFQFDVTDAVYTVQNQLMPVKVLYLQLSLAPGKPLQVFPAAVLQCLTVVQINATTNNPRRSQPIFFNVEQPPRHGRLGKSSLLFDVLGYNHNRING